MSDLLAEAVGLYKRYLEWVALSELRAQEQESVDWPVGAPMHLVIGVGPPLGLTLWATEQKGGESMTGLMDKEQWLEGCPQLEPVLDQMNELLALPADWNSYGAKPISPDACTEAFNILRNEEWAGPLPTVVPTPRGGVQLEWHSKERDVEIEVLPDWSIGVLIETRRNRRGRDLGSLVVQEALAAVREMGGE